MRRRNPQSATRETQPLNCTSAILSSERPIFFAPAEPQHRNRQAGTPPAWIPGQFRQEAGETLRQWRQPHLGQEFPKTRFLVQAGKLQINAHAYNFRLALLVSSL
jgi:hypothetical protein